MPRATSRAKRVRQVQMASLIDIVKDECIARGIELGELADYLCYLGWKEQAIETAKGMAAADEEPAGDVLTYSAEKEVQAMKSLAEDDRQFGVDWVEDIGITGFTFDPDYKKPVLTTDGALAERASATVKRLRELT